MSPSIAIRPLSPSEHEAWLRMREALWPESSSEQLAMERTEILENPNRNAVLVAAAPSGPLLGFVEVSIRDWAEGCATRPVGYIEAWYVEPAHRRSGLGRRLIEAAEHWSISQGCTEMGSDADVDNAISHRAHWALGYGEIGRAVLFSKKLQA
jgi:aminoglycoside 6'-N-acetyltransferase I